MTSKRTRRSRSSGFWFNLIVFLAIAATIGHLYWQDAKERAAVDQRAADDVRVARAARSHWEQSVATGDPRNLAVRCYSTIRALPHPVPPPVALAIAADVTDVYMPARGATIPVAEQQPAHTGRTQRAGNVKVKRAPPAASDRSGKAPAP